MSCGLPVLGWLLAVSVACLVGMLVGIGLGKAIARSERPDGE